MHPRDVPKDQWNSWSVERQEALKLIHRGLWQLVRVTYRTNDDGSTYFSPTHQCREFGSKSKKDFGYAMMYAFVRALMFIKSFEDEAGSVMHAEARSRCA
jgi:hypothetical protein